MSVKILVTGDYYPKERNLLPIKNGDYTSLFGDFLTYSSSSDLAITNLECPITDSTKKIKKTGPNHKVPYEAIKPIKHAGYALVTLANNHIMDYGEEGLKSTMLACEMEEVNYVGAGENLKAARKPFHVTLKNKKFAIVNIAENEFSTTLGNGYGANPLNIITNHYDIKEAKENADHVIVIFHGGREYYRLPTPKLRERLRFFVDSGADVVIGHHTHCFGGYENYNGKNIFYSLGNFIFDAKRKQKNEQWTQGYGVLLDFKETSIHFKVLPYHQGRKQSPNITLMNETEQDVFYQEIERINTIITNDTKFEEEWQKFIASQEKTYKSLLFVKNKYLRKAIKKMNLPLFIMSSKKHRMLMLNVMRCETHQEIMIDVLKNDLKTYFNR